MGSVMSHDPSKCQAVHAMPTLSVRVHPHLTPHKTKVLPWLFGVLGLPHQMTADWGCKQQKCILSQSGSRKS